LHKVGELSKGAEVSEASHNGFECAA